ncbi:hypothetical protein ACHQM5_019638 [Ranunculus cassubicifolius]
MGFHRNRLLLFLISVMISSFGESMNDSSRNSLDGLLQGYANKAIIHTGPVYNVTLPSNLSGAEASVVRLRSGNFWVTGTNFSNVLLPRRILPVPFVKRLDIIYINLRNLSSTYFNLSGYSLITPVVGFTFYDDTNTTATNVTRLNITVMEEPISIRFPQAELPQGSTATMKCVRFGDNGLTEFSEIGLNNVCLTRDQGYFAVVIPASDKREERIWRWLVVGFALGFASLVLCGLLGIIVYKCVKRRRMAEMEKRADEGESFENVWIGTIRMPSAIVARTKPVLEHNEVP